MSVSAEVYFLSIDNFYHTLNSVDSCVLFTIAVNTNTVMNTTVFKSHSRKLPKAFSQNSVLVRQSASSSCGSAIATKLAVGGDNGADHVCAVLGDGGLKCWGANDRGQLGIGTTTNMYTPIIVNLGSGVVLCRSPISDEHHMQVRYRTSLHYFQP
jgi:hypothetical protein